MITCAPSARILVKESGGGSLGYHDHFGRQLPQQLQEEADVPAAVVMRNREMLPLRDSLLDATPSFPV